MKDKKFVLKKSDKIIILIFIIYLIIMLAIFLPGYLYRKGTLYILNNDYQIKYKDGKWSNVKDTLEYSKKDFSVYENGDLKGNYKINYDGNIKKLVLIENYKRTNYDGILFAYSGSLKLKYINTKFYSEKEDADDYIIKEALSKAKISDTNSFAIRQKIKIDVDNDGNLDTIYNISGVDTNDQEYTFLFLYKNDKIYVIDKVFEITEYRTFDIVNVIDIRDDGKLELLYFESPVQTHDGGCLKMYNLGKGKKIHNFCE